MSNQFLAADLHLGHKGVTTFLAPNGVDKLRPWDNPDEMDEALIENWNSVVRPQDKVYVLGDVVLNRKHLHKVGRLNGKKHLVKGNHDICKLKEYEPYFYEVSACRALKDMILTHIPIHPANIGRFGVNVHGHTHAHKVMIDYEVHDRVFEKIPDPRYFCVSMEQIMFHPITLDEVREQCNRRRQAFPELFDVNEWHDN
jgi:calcineurin-like phosphoesterase family protein